MATRDEMKKRFQRTEEPGESRHRRTRKGRSSRLVERMRSPKPEPEGKPERKRYTRPGGRFSPCVDEDGDSDGVLEFSKYKGERISEMAKDREKAGFLYWVKRKHKEELEEGGPGFRTDLLTVINIQLGKA